jgi:5-formyltetrahydrofolate cyclo-ligase
MSEEWTKRDWRAELTRRRAGTDPRQIRILIQRAKDWVFEQRPTCVHGYLPKHDSNEIDTRDLLAILVASGVDVVVPRIVDVVTGSMELVSWHPDHPVRINRFGIDEPVGGRVVSGMDIDLWIVPLLGADKTGNRLGYGAGFYDRMLRGTPGMKVGLLPESCVVDALPVEPHDVPVDVVITENGVFNSYL